MTFREKYKIRFQSQTADNGLYKWASSSDLKCNALAQHLTDSNKSVATSQLEFINKALSGQYLFDPVWGEVKGSLLEVHQSEGMVEIGDNEIQLPTSDFKGIMEEWLTFIG